MRGAVVCGEGDGVEADTLELTFMAPVSSAGTGARGEKNGIDFVVHAKEGNVT